MAGNMIGLIAACCIGRPIAAFLMRRHDVAPSGDNQVGVGAVRDEETSARLNYYGVLLALFWLNIALMLGEAISELIKEAGLNLPTFVGCLIAGILLRNVMPRMTKRRRRLWNWNSMRHGVALISDVCLGMFLIMALMSLKLWELHGLLGFLAATSSLQVLMAAAFIVFVLFHSLGRDYEAVVRVRCRAAGLHRRAAGLRLFHRPDECADHWLHGRVGLGHARQRTPPWMMKDNDRCAH